jgi:ABC-2 type transport system ATP-binding protein
LTTWAIDAQHISKQFGQFNALTDVSFTVPQKSVFSILGPNGAGKTTLLRILTTITRPLTGTATIEGFSILNQVYQVRQQIGVVSQDNNFDRYLSIWHNLVLHAQMHGIPRPIYEARITQLLKQVDLYDRRHATPDVLSGGMKRRVSLIRALIHEPAVLFLDEPTTGLDPQARRELWATIEQFKQRATIILTTHYLEEADVLSDHIMMINAGRVVMTGTPNALKQQVTLGDSLELVFTTPAQAQQAADVLSTALPTSQWVVNPPQAERLLLNLVNPLAMTGNTTPKAQLGDVIPLISTEGLLRAGWIEPDLEDVFFQVAHQQSHKAPLSDNTTGETSSSTAIQATTHA